jgi:imidazolonepropionase-like amidohydrolase
MLKSITYLLLLISTFSIGQETPGEKQTKSILLLNGTAHLGNGKMIKRSAIGFENGTITMVENALTKTIDTTNFDTIIHIKGKHVYPGFIACNSTLGLMDIGAVRATRDYREVGAYNPNVRSLIAYNTDSKITPTIRTNGILIGQICPRGGVVSGSSSIVQFDAWNWEDAVLQTTKKLRQKINRQLC